MNAIKLIVIFIGLLVSMAWANNALSAGNIKLYTLDCGSYDVSDMQSLSSTGAYDGQKLKMANPCFLISHPKGDLLWETGHVDSLADTVDGVVAGVWHSKLKTKLVTQLAQLNIKPQDIEYLSLSHIHPDHAGNANKFASSTFIVNKLEHDFMFSEPAKSNFGAYYSALKQSKTLIFNGEYDVFDDSSVVITSMPGHTPGSSVLLIRLNNAGNILLTGDLYLHARGRKLNTVLQYNAKELTLDSRVKFETLAKKENARVIIQHDKQDFAKLPVFPKYLD
ncbi:MAG: N-acyl homoserine lactonase family protein [Colwellia sp.]|nr:N-acyl homoserine lactonase family protein [Colwellia sp.]